MDRRTALQAGLAAACAAAAPRAFAQPQFPAGPVRLIVTFPAGGPTDITARALAEATSRHLGHPVLVENRPGAAGTLGYAALATARPDGSAILAKLASQAIAAGEEQAMDLPPGTVSAAAGLG